MKLDKHIVPVILLLLLFWSESFSQTDARIMLRASPTDAFIGDQLELKIVIHAPFARDFRLPPLEQSVGPFTILEQQVSRGTGILGGSVLIHRLKVTAFSVGDHILPELAYEVISESGEAAPVKSPRLMLPVRSVSDDEEGPETVLALTDILRPEDEAEDSFTWWIWAAGALILAIIALLVWLRFRTPSSVRNLLRKTPAEQALDDLYKLEKQNLLSKEEYDPFFTGLSHILRRYLGLRYHILALEMTSSELNSTMAALWENGEFDTNSFTDLLAACDLAKFARMQPGIRKGEESLETGRQVVLATRDDHRPGAKGGAG